VREADLGIFIGVEVVATNAGGDSDPADSDAFGPVRGALSANLTPPTIAGVAQEGQLLTASPGTWSGSPTGYGFQWYRCVQLFPSPQCTAIVGATASTYDVATADVGRRLFVGVTAINAG
jgi:hypothetical protein